MDLPKIIERLRKQAANGPALMAYSREDAQRLVNYIDTAERVLAESLRRQTNAERR